MLNEEKAKRKEKSKEKWPLSAFLLPLFACILICGASWLMFMRHSSDVPLLDGLSSGKQAQAVILERLPLGSSRAEVESFIAESLQPSATNTCSLLDEGDSICIMAIGRIGICSGTVWDIIFYFENQELTEVKVLYAPYCIY